MPLITISIRTEYVYISLHTYFADFNLDLLTEHVPYGMGEWMHKIKWRCFILLGFSAEGNDRNAGFLRNIQRRVSEKCEQIGAA